MPLTSSPETTIVRSDRGLVIAGTRVTLYDVMDYLHAGWPPKLIQNWLPLSAEQLDCALSYIEAHRSEVEQEYQTVLQIAQDNRQYWEARNRERLAKIAALPPKAGQEEIYAKLQAWKVQLGLTS